MNICKHDNYTKHSPARINRDSKRDWSMTGALFLKHDDVLSAWDLLFLTAHYNGVVTTSLTTNVDDNIASFFPRGGDCTVKLQPCTLQLTQRASMKRRTHTNETHDARLLPLAAI